MPLFRGKYSADTEGTRPVRYIGAVGGTLDLRLSNHSPTLHKLVASGQAQVGALGAQFTVYRVDEALAATTASVSERLTFNNVLERQGLLKELVLIRDPARSMQRQ